jgi:hypothetical protein
VGCRVWGLVLLIINFSGLHVLRPKAQGSGSGFRVSDSGALDTGVRPSALFFTRIIIDGMEKQQQPTVSQNRAYYTHWILRTFKTCSAFYWPKNTQQTNHWSPQHPGLVSLHFIWCLIYASGSKRHPVVSLDPCRLIRCRSMLLETIHGFLKRQSRSSELPVGDLLGWRWPVRHVFELRV